MKAGILGGSFNPIHIGHTRLACAAADELGLEKVLIIPVAEPAHKPSDEVLPADLRFEMCALACAQDKRLRAVDIELNRWGKSYTYDTVEQLSRMYPENEWYFIMGGDMLLTFDSWYRAENLAKMMTLVAAARDAGEYSDLQHHADILKKKMGARVQLLTIPAFEISSTKIREMIPESSEAEHFLYPAVWEYIKENRLYGIEADDLEGEQDGPR